MTDAGTSLKLLLIVTSLSGTPNLKTLWVFSSPGEEIDGGLAAWLADGVFPPPRPIGS